LPIDVLVDGFDRDDLSFLDRIFVGVFTIDDVRLI